MRIKFTNNVRPTVGVELELHIVDAETGDLVNAAPKILAEAGTSHPGGIHPRAKPELFQSTIEMITEVCCTPAEAKADLAATLYELRTAADRRGLTFVSAGTHPFGLAREQIITENPRYRALIESMQWPARRLITCGTHVHVGVKSGERAIVIFNELQRHLPLFLIASSSSPYLEGEDTGLASTRSKVFESLPTAGLPPVVEDWADFESFMHTLLEARCINSIREVWWDVRPHPDFGTVELRMCDAASTLRETTAIAALAQALVARIDERMEDGTLARPPRDWTIRENRWLAARHGVEAELIVDSKGTRRPAVVLLEELIDDLRPIAERLGSSEELEDLLELWETGPSYLRQRRVADEGGSLRDVVARLAEELEADTPLGD